MVIIIITVFVWRKTLINQIKAHSHTRHSHAITQATEKIANLHRLGDRGNTRTPDMRMHSVQATHNNTDMGAEVAPEIIAGETGEFLDWI